MTRERKTETAKLATQIVNVFTDLCNLSTCGQQAPFLIPAQILTGRQFATGEKFARTLQASRSA